MVSILHTVIYMDFTVRSSLDHEKIMIIHELLWMFSIIVIDNIHTVYYKLK